MSKCYVHIMARLLCDCSWALPCSYSPFKAVYIHNKLFTHCLRCLYIRFNKDESKIILNLDLQHNIILDVKEAHIFVQVYNGAIYTKYVRHTSWTVNDLCDHTSILLTSSSHIYTKYLQHIRTLQINAHYFLRITLSDTVECAQELILKFRKMLNTCAK